MERRSFLKSCACIAAVGATEGLSSSHAEAASKKPESMRPKPGDQLVVEDGHGNARVISASELKLEVQQIMAFPQDPVTGVIRSGSRFNKVMVMRLNPELMDEDTKKNSADGVVAYSAICTHQGCDVNSYIEDKKEFFCFCHYSRFNPYEAGKVTNGPATRRLAMLPIEIKDDFIIVKEPFTRKPGYKK
ncbi:MULTISPECIES: ubiquinol-cytochrome c reductase iron-sulfur subunit [unclassified Neptuniibacter]|uniref:QcrA and Rieske domain-containing protein n=1 Tax=unclassified Neptuniibacter TaxID=2630693 RepID=UPI0026E1C1E3|nr:MULTISPECIES: Rieske 2Fe-2S domain-containing protein [unclassified Neptuniibacter]MDO6515188.1 Rieske 2Fe-2S domain-containing protein [Neptuniibacter sp. 2_MG-2023]MDO6592222.1 Rieske 2Fe-2S domain-containing protein [Neptuniibacter sp. 1_MG-2023]